MVIFFFFPNILIALWIVNRFYTNIIEDVLLNRITNPSFKYPFSCNKKKKVLKIGGCVVFLSLLREAFFPAATLMELKSTEFLLGEVQLAVCCITTTAGC